MAHLCDSEVWKHFDRIYPNFVSDPRNIRLGLCIDGFNPFGYSSTPYSYWSVLITVYNLSPWMCLKRQYIFLNMIIPGLKSPGRNIDVFLIPLIEQLKQLWGVGVNTYDVSRRQNF